MILPLSIRDSVLLASMRSQGFYNKSLIKKGTWDNIDPKFSHIKHKPLLSTSTQVLYLLDFCFKNLDFLATQLERFDAYLHLLFHFC